MVLMLTACWCRSLPIAGNNIACVVTADDCFAIAGTDGNALLLHTRASLLFAYLSCRVMLCNRYDSYVIKSSTIFITISMEHTESFDYINSLDESSEQVYQHISMSLMHAIAWFR